MNCGASLVFCSALKPELLLYSANGITSVVERTP